MTTASFTGTRFRLGPRARFTLDLEARTLFAEGQAVALGSRGFDLLAALVQAGGALLGKDELMRRAWAGLVVDEANLHVQISALRRLLAAEAIATVQAQGYRWAWPCEPVAETPGPRHNLPAERSSFVGRGALQAAGRQALERCRLLSLIGIGGAGKTRLALALGRQLRDQLADGVWWVDLGALDRAERVPATVAQTLGLPLDDGGNVERQLGQALQSRQLLLILDNCEHLLAGVARLADAWLDAVPGLKIIATSREALAAPGEWVLPVGPLALPGAGATDDEISACEAVQLLAERAAQVAPPAGPAAIDAAVLAEICRRVDGIPLAIEIAAAQLRTVSPARLLGLLEERFRLLANLAHAQPRQRMMQTVIEWSFDHLQPHEQELLLGLALCSGGCDFDAARSLMGPQASAVALTAALGRLAEQALMAVQRDGSEPRYRLLETVAQFALDRLGTQPLAAALRARFVAHFLALAEAHDEEILRLGRGAATLDQIDRERGNLQRALQFCLQSDDAAAWTDALRLVGALRHYWLARSQPRLGLELTQAAVRRAGAGRVPDRPLLLALVSEGQLLAALDQPGPAAQVMERAARMAGALGETAHRISSLGFRAGLLDRLERFDEAAAEHESARRLAADTGDEVLLADALSRQAAHASHRGHFDDAAALLAQALPLRRRLGHGYRLAVALLNSAAVAARRGRWDEARPLLSEVAPLLDSVGSDALDAAFVRLAVGGLHRAGAWAEVVFGLAAASRYRDQAGLPGEPDDEAQAEAQRADARAALTGPAFEAAQAGASTADIAQARRRLADALCAPPPPAIPQRQGSPTEGTP